MRKVLQGVVLTLLLTTPFLISMPLTPAKEMKEEKEQGQRVITAVNGRSLENPIPVNEFFKHATGKGQKQQGTQERRGSQEREEKKDPTIGSTQTSQASKKKENAERNDVRVVSTRDQKDPYINITLPANGTNFPYNNQTGCTVTIEWNASASAGIDRFTIDWTAEEERNETQVIENGSVRMATHTYTYHRANHTIRLTVVDRRGRRDSDVVFIRDTTYVVAVHIKRPYDGANVSGTTTIKAHGEVVVSDGNGNIKDRYAPDEIHIYLDGEEVDPPAT